MTARTSLMERGRRQRGRARTLLLRHTLLHRFVPPPPALPGRARVTEADRTAGRADVPRRVFFAPVILAPPETFDADVSPFFTPSVPEEAAPSSTAEPLLADTERTLIVAPGTETTDAPTSDLRVPAPTIQRPSAERGIPDALYVVPAAALDDTPHALVRAESADALTTVNAATAPSPQEAQGPATASAAPDLVAPSPGRPASFVTNGDVPGADRSPVAEPPAPPVAGRRRPRIEEVAAPTPPSQTEFLEEADDASPLAGDQNEALPTPRRARPTSEDAAKFPPSPGAVAADDLFPPAPGPQAEGRAPAVWLARLQAAALGAPAPPPVGDDRTSVTPATPNRVIAPPRSVATTRQSSSTDETPGAAPLPLPEPTPISQNARRFLRPLVGIDPASVPIYRGDAAARASDALNADALAVGGQAVVLGSEADAAGDEAPETLGLLAHELTHIAQRQTPRFVPPIVAGDAAAEQTPEIVPVPSFSSTSGDAGTADEAVAQQAEVAVRRRALDVRAVSAAEKGAVETAPAPVGAGPKPQRVTLTPPAPVNPDEWNGLPAPWEPLPAWVNPSATIGGAAALVPASSGQAAATEDAGSFVQRAPTDRSLPAMETTDAAASPAPAAPLPAPPPDLDALAQQVYDRLKRRLAAEQRQRFD